MEQIVRQCVDENIAATQAFFNQNLQQIETCAVMIKTALDNGNKLLLFGNGGSAADCQHIAAEFVNRFQMERCPLPGLALTTDTSVITSIGNDYSFDDIFLKQIQALGKPGDIALGISTSGNSPNVIKAMTEARRMGLKTIGFSGQNGQLAQLSDAAFCVDSPVTARIQEVHILLAHILCDLVERMVVDA